MTVTKLITSTLLLALTAFVSFAHATSDIADRLKPVGSVCIEGTECEAAAGAASTASSGPRSGSDVYNTYCTACHGTGAMGAPKTGDVAAWDSRLAKGFDKTLQNAINGINMMPANGTCTDCSEDEIAAAIKYMTK
ncbi:c-type cytochrome [Bermanella sp. R86510]|uniref:c-type cytochrome n=1 Tax=unclassified Bermanella TaxID=2627862 RepID=UPI0037C5DF3F